ncbi:MAG TPA: hypothetical protein VG759_09260 [Candidatus Angelobacter sp.]|nr:hypothetical protein [Candidatus Angelobacter sp.]
MSFEIIPMKPRDLTEVLKDAPTGEWIALSRDKTRIVGHGISIEDAMKSAQESGEEKYTLFKMPMPNIGIATPAKTKLFGFRHMPRFKAFLGLP